MLLNPLLTATLVLPLLSLAKQHPLPLSTDYASSFEAAQENAPHIFNALHSSMRQWGSSLKHNGLSFFPASIPADTYLYHGTHDNKPETGMEWLAFEIEHAEAFARAWGPPPKRPGKPPPGDGPRRNELRDEERIANHFGPPENSGKPGYLHIYQTTRKLSKILYIDGMSAGKTKLGTLDSTDMVLRNKTGNDPPWGEYERAEELCELGTKWDIEGFIRLEAGFELILCNFTNGLEFKSARRRPKQDPNQFEYMRAVAARYQGITAGRVEVDYSSMVSAFFYPINLTNPNPKRAELPRLVSSEVGGVRHIQEDLEIVLESSQRFSNERIDWQGVVDMIVTRYSDRLQYMVLETTTQEEIQATVSTLLSLYVDFDDPKIPLANTICTYHYLNSTQPTTSADHLIHSAIATVSEKICSTLFEVRRLIEEESPAVETAKLEMKDLIAYLDWSTWLECGKCAYDEVCYVAVWPWGTIEDHFHPSCKNSSLDFGRDRQSYWGSY